MTHIRLLLLAVGLSILTCCGSAQTMSVTSPDSQAYQQPASADNNSQSEPKIETESSLEAAIKAVYLGQFEKARKISSTLDPGDPNVAAFQQSVSQYFQTTAQLKKENQKALQGQLDELEKLKARSEANEPNVVDVFSVAVKIRDLSPEPEKDKISHDPFIKKTVQKAIAKADKLEQKGRWMDSLLECYSWLTILYADNQQYADHKDKLTEKLLIKSSLTDSPCEDTAARYRGIEKHMFTRALEVLQYGYVSPFSYSDMFKASVDKCINLAQVLAMEEKYKDPNSPRADAQDHNSPSDQQDIQPQVSGGFNIEYNAEKIPEFIAGLNGIKSALGQHKIDITRDQYVKMFDSVIELNNETIAIKEDVLIAQFAEASLAEIDPHTVLIWPKQTSDFKKNMTNEFTGVGIEISKSDGLLKATSLLPGTPAYYSGLDAGDIIEEVDGQPTIDMSINCAVSKITGPAGTDVVLTVRSKGAEKSRRVKITRAKIVVPTIRGWLRKDNGRWNFFVDEKQKIGYVRLTSFSGNTTKEFKKVLKDIESRGLKALVLDLRYNSGGYLQTAAQITDLFVSEGIIVSSQPRFGVPSWEPAHKKGTRSDYPLVIMVNNGSASASEIVAGALADPTHSRAVLVGERTYGKGSVQTITDYPGGGSQLKYTMAHYHLPNGDKVKSRFQTKKAGKKDWGIMPNVEIELNNEQVKKIFDIQRQNDVLPGPAHDKNIELERHPIDAILKADAQLAAAVLIARAKIIESRL